MNALLILSGISLLVALVFLFTFIWSVYSDRFENKKRSPIRIRVEDKNNTHKKRT